MVEIEKDTAKRARHTPLPELGQPQQQRRQNYQKVSLPPSSPRRVAPQSRLHNFSFPSVSWGNQRLLRCAKHDFHGVSVAEPCEASKSISLDDRGSVGGECGRRMRQAHDRKAAEGNEEVEKDEDEDELLDKFRNSMMAEFRKAFDRISLPPPRAALVQEEEREKSPVAEGARPWNLRIRRAACNAPADGAENGKMRSSPLAPEKKSSTPNKNPAVPVKYSLRSDSCQSKEERPKFSPVLSKEEVEEDFFAMTGAKPPRRSKKRPRNLQKHLEGIFPGSYLTEVTTDLYKITRNEC